MENIKSKIEEINSEIKNINDMCVEELIKAIKSFTSDTTEKKRNLIIKSITDKYALLAYEKQQEIEALKNNSNQ